jgi:hypothetical protein
MNHIKKLHDEWAKAVMPPNASQIQRQEMERAFYAGFCRCLTYQITEIQNLSDEDGSALLEKLQEESVLYFIALKHATLDISRQ